MSEEYISLTQGSGVDVSTVRLTIDSQLVDIERSLHGVGEVTVPGTPQVNAVSSTGLTPASGIDIRGRYYIICKNTFNDNAATAAYRLVFLDTADAIIGYSENISINNLGYSDSSRYFGDNVVYANTFGARKLKFQITSLSSGDNLSIYVMVT